MEWPERKPEMRTKREGQKPTDTWWYKIRYRLPVHMSIYLVTWALLYSMRRSECMGVWNLGLITFISITSLQFTCLLGRVANILIHLSICDAVVGAILFKLLSPSRSWSEPIPVHSFTLLPSRIVSFLLGVPYCARKGRSPLQNSLVESLTLQITNKNIPIELSLLPPKKIKP